MPSSLRFRLLATVVFVAGIAATLGGVAASVWAYQTDDVWLVFRVALPALTVWLLLAMLHLAWKLMPFRGKTTPEDWGDPMARLLAAPKRAPDSDIRRKWPDAEFCQHVLLPAEPGASWMTRGRRRRIALLVGLRGGARHFRIAQASCLYREMPVHRPEPTRR
jgi:hypothetical protein